MPRKASKSIDPDLLKGFRLLERFTALFDPLDQRRTKDPRELDPRRKFGAHGYFSMMLLALINPVIDSMRGLCAVSKSRRFAQDMKLPPVSLASFSEAQEVFDPELLRGVLRQLLAQKAPHLPHPLQDKLGPAEIEAIDSTVWQAVGRMKWASWRQQFSTRQNAVRLHLRWRLFGAVACGGAEVVAARECERRVLRHELLEPDIIYVGDRNYSGDYTLLERIGEVGADFIVRLQDQAVIEPLESLPLKAADRAAGLTHHFRVALGHRNAPDRGWRLIRLQTPNRSAVTLVTSLPVEKLGALEIAEIYRCRWQIEGFFRWLKCILPCRRWLAEGPRGVATQVYCALIAALLLANHQGKLPTKRQLEAIRLWMMGWLEDDELAQWLGLTEKS